MCAAYILFKSIIRTFLPSLSSLHIFQFLPILNLTSPTLYDPTFMVKVQSHLKAFKANSSMHETVGTIFRSK